MRTIITAAVLAAIFGIGAFLAWRSARVPSQRSSTALAAEAPENQGQARLADDNQQPIPTTHTAAGNLGEGEDVAGRALTELSNTIAVNPRLLTINGAPTIICSIALKPKDYTPSQPTEWGDLESRHALALLQIHGEAALKTVTPERSPWNNNGYGDFGICRVNHNSGYLLGPLLTETSGEPVAFFQLRWYKWAVVEGQLRVDVMKGIRSIAGYINADMIYFKQKIVAAAESVDDTEELCVATLTDPTQGCRFSPIAENMRGSYPRFCATEEKLYLIFTHFSGYYRLTSKASLYLSTSDDGVNWAQPRQLLDKKGVIQSSIIADNAGTLFVVYSTLEREVGEMRPGNYNLSCARQFFRHTTLWLTSSTDQGVTWRTPQRVTDGLHADHYPELAIIDGHLRLFWTRFSSTAPDNPYAGAIAGNLMTADYGEAEALRTGE